LVILVRQLDARDAADYQGLRLRALRECPTAFSASHADEAQRSIDEIERRVTAAPNGSFCMFGACAGEALVGFVAFVRPQRDKLAHGAELAGMYVASEFRQRGIGRLLIDALIAHARSLNGVRQLKLAVTRSNVSARKLYESAGFVSFGTESEALYVDGTYHDEEHFMLRLV
jgi:ribosomal protein S18 acetylase RimI-like enzyme